jgi:hypothetical protein
VSCDRAGIALHGYFDDELDSVDASDFERHLESTLPGSMKKLRPRFAGNFLPISVSRAPLLFSPLVVSGAGWL